jgi:serine/threonine-protein phosphatase 2A activator
MHSLQERSERLWWESCSRKQYICSFSRNPLTILSYIELIRKLILTYTLEPAGSHGVWGLDDHSFAPYIFGSAQLGPPIASPNAPTPLQGSLDSAPAPDTITSKPTVTEHKSSNMYFSAIQFIFDVKKGPFWEHSPILFNISGIKDGWGKINKGMLKMYDAEVLGKFPVVQHFPFGQFFKWERDPEAAKSAGPSVHSQQQPPSLGTATNTSSAPGAAAPWAQQTSSSQPQTGMPSTRAPWASAGAASVPGMAPMAAPWASTTASRVPPSGASNRNYPPTAPSTSTYGRMPPPAAAARGSGTEAPWKRNG